MASQKISDVGAGASPDPMPTKAGRKPPSGSGPSRRGPSVAALASLSTLAVCLWFEVELSSALFRSVLVYLGISLLALLYRVILGHYLSVSQERAHEEFLQRMQREAEEEAAQAKKEEAAPGRGAAAHPGPASGGKSATSEAKAPKAAEAAKT